MRKDNTETNFNLDQYWTENKKNIKKNHNM